MDRRYVEMKRSSQDVIKDRLESILKNEVNIYEDMPSTQDVSVLKRSRNVDSTDEPMIPGTLDMRFKNDPLSSPLKDNEIILDSQASDILKQNDINVPTQTGKAAKSRHANSPTKCVSWSQTSSKKLDAKPAYELLVDFNTNPKTGKPWIYEDFKVNELQASRGRKKTHKSNKIARFHANAGSPVKVNQKIVLDNGVLHDSFDSSPMDKKRVPDLQFQDDSFENLKVRSKSPPGFGRLNFPTTQERLEDKQESNRLLYQKTKNRFIEATNKLVPISEREFYFRNSKLNDIVDDGNFTWHDNKLQIFTRTR